MSASPLSKLSLRAVESVGVPARSRCRRKKIRPKAGNGYWHGYLRTGRAGYEKFNFLPGPRGRCYGYLPPIGHQHAAPRPAPPHGWLIVFVAAEGGHGPLRPVGWYEDARFEPMWTIPRLGGLRADWGGNGPPCNRN